MCWEGHWVGVRGLRPSPRSPVNQLHVLGSRAGPLLLEVGGCGSGGGVSHLENRMSLDRHCSLQTIGFGIYSEGKKLE